jgi:hypothetical protein
MKKILVLSLMFLCFSFASAEVPKALEDDVGTELVSFVDSVSLDVVVLNQSESFDYCISHTSTLENVNRIDRTFFVPSYNGADMFRRSLYEIPYLNKTDQPPLATLFNKKNKALVTISNKLSSFRSVDEQLSLRA